MDSLASSFGIHAVTLPFDTIQQMVNSCQGLDDLQGISMPRNYVSASVRQGKAIKIDQPKSNPMRADLPLQIVHFDLFGRASIPLSLDINTV